MLLTQRTVPCAYLAQQAIAANGAVIDGATGASMTSAGFKEAVAAALELAK